MQLQIGVLPCTESLNITRFWRDKTVLIQAQITLRWKSKEAKMDNVDLLCSISYSLLGQECLYCELLTFVDSLEKRLLTNVIACNHDNDASCSSALLCYADRVITHCYWELWCIFQTIFQVRSVSYVFALIMICVMFKLIDFIDVWVWFVNSCCGILHIWPLLTIRQ